MSGVILVLIGVALMLTGSMTLVGWLGGKSRFFSSSVYDRQGTSKTDRMFIDLYFVSTVLAPLLGGAILIVIGLLRLL